ncbi:MAG: divalent cation tolerance protein CutA [Planctomycetia bacterium]|nr:divalent cation tolerance protein CutA [Planctomycetia bacterium]
MVLTVNSDKVNNNSIIILSTVPSVEEGEKLAAQLVERKLSACVNIFPKMISVYYWDNNINKDDEFLLIIKTAEHLEHEVYEFITNNHSYEVPEIITVDIKNIDKKYSEWLNSSIKPKTNG